MGVHNGIKGCGRERLKFILEERLLMGIYIKPNAGGGLREISCQGLDESEVATSINAKKVSFFSHLQLEQESVASCSSLSLLVYYNQQKCTFQ